MVRTEGVGDDGSECDKRCWKRRRIWGLTLVMTLIGLTIGTLTNLGWRVVKLMPDGFDKAMHGLMHGIIVVCTIEVWKIRTTGGRLAVWSGSVCVGIMVELGQELVTRDRKADYQDAIAAAIGSFSAWLPRDRNAPDARRTDAVDGRTVERDEECGTISPGATVAGQESVGGGG